MLKRYKPTSSGMRQRKALVLGGVLTPNKKREKRLSSPKKGPAGRDNGTISIRHRQRGAKKHYREIDFKRNKFGIPARVAAIEYDPNRAPNIALLSYADGEKRYILAPAGLEVGMEVVSGQKVEAKIGNAMQLQHIPAGVEIHNIELNPGAGAKLARSAGNKAIILAKEGEYVNIRLPSGEVKKVLGVCYGTVGALGNEDHRHINLGKAGKSRHLGRRPTVRGIAIANPSDHPHGGSYKDNGTGHPMTPWGRPTRGKKTRQRNRTNRFVVSPRKKRR